MSRVLAGVVTNPDGSPASDVKITLVAKRTEAVSLLEGATFSFSTGVDGSYSEAVLDGFYSVLVGRRGADIGLGDIVVEAGDTISIEALLALGNSVADPVDTALLQLVADAQQAADEAQAAAAGLSEVDNTADINKPVSIAQLALINTKFAIDKVGVAGGAASLDGSGFLHTSQLPPMAIGETFVVSAEADKLTLSAQTGDVAVVQGASDEESKTYRLAANDPSLEANWVQLLFPSGNATTLAGNAAAYYLDWNNFQNVPTTFLPAAHGHTKSEVGLDRVDNTSDAEKPVSVPQLAEIEKRINVAGLASCGLLTAHGLMKEPCAAKDFDCPATVANQFTIKANRYRVGSSLIDVPDTVVTLPAAPNTGALLSRRDVVYLREDGSIGVFEGLDDHSDMVTAGFTSVAGEAGLWQEGTGFAVALALVKRRNQGAHHEYFNERGCAAFQEVAGGGANARLWYDSLAVDVLSTSDCFTLITPNLSYRGNIGTLNPSRPDDLLYDAIYLSDITDPRLQATAPTPIQLEPDYWLSKAVAGTLKNFVTEGIPFIVVKERGVVEALANSTTDGGLVSVGDSSLYEVGSFVEVITEAGRYVTAGYVAEQVTATILRLRTTLAAAIGNLAEKLQPIDRINGDTYIVQKVEYTTAQGADNTRTDIIGDPANYPRQATGVIDLDTNDGTVAFPAGHTCEILSNNTTTSIATGNVVMRVGTDVGSIDLATAAFSGASWLDLGTKATFLANAQGMEGFPLLYGENGEDLIPDGSTVKEMKLSRKCEDSLGRVQSTDKGVSWGFFTTWDADFESASNSRSEAVSASLIAFLTYKTPANIWSEDVNSAVLAGKLSKAWATNSSELNQGSSLASDLIGKVPVNGAFAPSQKIMNVEGYKFNYPAGTLNTNSTQSPTHNPMDLAGTGPAAKAVFYQSADAGEQVKLHALAKEMIFDATWGDDGTFSVVSGVSTVLDGNSNTVLAVNKSTKLPIRMPS